MYACGVCNEVYNWERKVLIRLNGMLYLSFGSKREKARGGGQMVEHSGDPGSNLLRCW